MAEIKEVFEGLKNVQVEKVVASLRQMRRADSVYDIADMWMKFSDDGDPVEIAGHVIKVLEDQYKEMKAIVESYELDKFLEDDMEDPFKAIMDRLYYDEKDTLLDVFVKRFQFVSLVPFNTDALRMSMFLKEEVKKAEKAEAEDGEEAED